MEITMMIHISRGAFIGFLVSILSAQNVLAQAMPHSRGFLSIIGGYQANDSDFSDGATRPANGENGHLDTAYKVKSGPIFAVAGGATLWKQLGVRIGVGR